MAYGKNKQRKNWSMRAMPLAVGDCTTAKRGELARLQSRVLDLMRRMATQAFVAEPLGQTAPSGEVEAMLIQMQKDAVWAEQARMRVMPALDNGIRSYFGRFVGSLRHVDSAIPPEDCLRQRADDFIGPPAPTGCYYHVPLAIQDDITSEELSPLKAVAESGAAIDLIRRVVIHRDRSGPTANQVTILEHIHHGRRRVASVRQTGVWQAAGED
jgi:hypothetical protein